MKTRQLQGLAAMLALGAGTANATNHEIKIVEVFPGTVSQPGAQYVVLQMYDAFQNFVTNQSLQFYDTQSSDPFATVTFGSDVAVGTNQAKLLIATPSAATLFNITPDLVMDDPNVLAAGGKICWNTTTFGIMDCVAWGNHPGTSSSIFITDVGPPFSKGYGLVPGVAMIRRLDIAGGASTLENGDDTNNCKNDFVSGVPAPRNNAGQAGTLPAATCGNGTIEGIESCDDGNTTPGDGCSATCQFDDGVFRDEFEGF